MAKNPASQHQPRQQVVPPPSGTTFDMIIIGGGTIGLSAAYYASARGLNTLLLEQFDSLAGGNSSSGGASRMFRIMYSQDYMARLAETSLALWREIETAAEAQILQMQPLLFYGDSENTVEGNLNEIQQVLTNLGVPYTSYPNPAGMLQQYPAFQTMPPSYSGLAQANSAVIRAESSIAAFELLAAGAGPGATMLTGQPATITAASTEGPYEVSCPAGTYSAPCLVLCPGPWTNYVLAPLGIQLNLTIWQMTVAYFQAEVDNYAYPLWYEFGPPQQNQQSLFYGFPPDEVPGYLKVSADFTNNIYTDPNQCTHQPDPQILSQIGNFLQQRFNGVSPTPSQPSTCLYTMSPDAEMILDRLGYHNVAIFTGASGRGFKFTPLFGRILVDLALTGETYYDISPFSINRPGIIKS